MKNTEYNVRVLRVTIRDLCDVSEAYFNCMSSLISCRIRGGEGCRLVDEGIEKLILSQQYDKVPPCIGIVINAQYFTIMIPKGCIRKELRRLRSSGISEGRLNVLLSSLSHIISNMGIYRGSDLKERITDLTGIAEVEDNSWIPRSPRILNKVYSSLRDDALYVVYVLGPKEGADYTDSTEVSIFFPPIWVEEYYRESLEHRVSTIPSGREIRLKLGDIILICRGIKNALRGRRHR